MGFLYETNESDSVEVFKTHYYKTSYDDLKKAILEYASQNGLEQVAWNDDYCEGSLVNSNTSLTLKIIMQNPRETSIDFTIEVTSLFGAKRKAITLLNDIYAFLGNKFELKGLGLHVAG